MRRIVLVLGGGGVKGMAHAGVWRAIEETGVEVVAIVGTSTGSLVGAAIAAGQGWRELTARASSFRKSDIAIVNRWAVLLNGIRQPSLFRAEPLRAYIAAVLGEIGFADLRIPLSVNAVDLGSGREVWFGDGGRTDVSLVDAVYASCALPVFYPPAEIDGRYLVDGGVLNPLAVARAASAGADMIVAVDVGAGPGADAAKVVARGIVAIHHRVLSIGGHARRRALLDRWSGPPLLYVRPRLDDYETFDFANTSYFLEEGYRATREALATVPNLPGEAEELAG